MEMIRLKNSVGLYPRWYKIVKNRFITVMMTNNIKLGK
uniref:Uncharacterized protein n=2 Tax=unclassified Salmonella TaxID=2614656 RepID=I3W3R0_9ENTR|nr:hypothetical protein [Salmonella sp. 14]AFK90237.1 hypothetical protein [Salmonella sp. 40]